MGLERVFRIENDLRDAITIPQVKEYKLAEVAATRHPPHQGHSFPYVLRSQGPAGMRAL
jgi:hypothetical protein